MELCALVVTCVVILFLLFKNQKSELELALSKTPNLALLVTNRQNHIKFINKKFETIFNLKRKEHLHKSLNELLISLNFDDLNELFKLNAKDQSMREVVIRHGEIYLRFRLSNVLKNAKEFDGFILTVADITHEKELEMSKIKNEQMLLLSSKMAVVGEMVSAISHQQRSPLSAVMLCLDEIEECVLNDKFNDISLQVDRAKRNIGLINETISSFAKFYRNDNKICEVDLLALVGELAFIARPKLNEHGIKLVFNASSTQKFIVNSVSAYIKQILLSLISNAKDELARLLLENPEFLPAITVELENLSDEICISVSDNGGGIDSESAIFDPFFTTKGNSGGTGMGLYIASILAHQKLNANLVLQSAKNPTKFCLFIKKL